MLVAMSSKKAYRKRLSAFFHLDRHIEVDTAMVVRKLDLEFTAPLSRA
jgi:hypothetical protein